MTGVVKQAMRIASVEKVELENIMELSLMGQVLKSARQMNFSFLEDCHYAKKLDGT